MKTPSLDLSPEKLAQKKRAQKLSEFKMKLSELLQQFLMDGYFVEMFPGTDRDGRITVVTGIRELSEGEKNAFNEMKKQAEQVANQAVAQGGDGEVRTEEVKEVEPATTE